MAGRVRAAFAAAVLAGAGCAGGPAAREPSRPPIEREDPAAMPRLEAAGYRAEFDLWWRGRPAGVARESIVATGDGLRFERRELWWFARGGTPHTTEVRIVIDTDAHLAARRIRVARDGRWRGSAGRAPAGWMIRVSGEEPRASPPAEPVELTWLRMALARSDRLRGPVLLSGLDFAAADLDVRVTGSSGVAVLAAPTGRIELRAELRPDRTIESIAAGEIQARRAPHRGASEAAPIELVDVIESSSLPLGREAGSPSVPPASWPRLAVPDPPPSRRVAALARHALASAGARSSLDRVRALARATAAALIDDLAPGATTSADQALETGRADCTGHAALFSALARASGFDIRLVTGYRIDRERKLLVRHIWSLVRLGDRIVAIDPTTGDAPAPADQYIPLAIHGSASAEILLAAELAYAPR